MAINNNYCSCNNTNCKDNDIIRGNTITDKKINNNNYNKDNINNNKKDN